MPPHTPTEDSLSSISKSSIESCHTNVLLKEYSEKGCDEVIDSLNITTARVANSPYVQYPLKHLRVVSRVLRYGVVANLLNTSLLKDGY